jgi:hypothetical protein
MGISQPPVANSRPFSCPAGANSATPNFAIATLPTINRLDIRPPAAPHDICDGITITPANADI